MPTRLFLSLVRIALAFLPACASSQEPAPLVVDPLPPRAARSRSRAAASAPALASAPVIAGASAAAPDPVAVRFFLERFDRPSFALSTDVRPSRVLELALDGSVRGETGALSPAGPRLGVTLGEGEHARLPVSFEAGACVTVVAQGGLGVVEIDVFLTSGEPGPAHILAQDARSGPTSVIGGREGCFVVNTAVEGALFVQMRKGSGMALVQRFAR